LSRLKQARVKIVFLSQFMEKEYSTENENNTRKRLVWKKPLMTDNGFVELGNVMETDSRHIL